jgi:exonuclease SbcC
VRPLELELTGFRSYDSERIDWRPYDLVVIAGDTGAGKSTLLDGICFALYGRTPETARTGDMLTLGRDHGEVRLTFARDGEVWRITRRFGPRAPEPAHILERLSGDGGEPTQTIAGEQAVNRRILHLVGLGFPAFTSAVVLAQGRFAQFLQARAADRDAILRELFGIESLDGARVAAQAAQASAQARADLLEQERARLPEHGPGVRGAAARAARDAAARRAALQALAPDAAAVREAHRRAEDALTRAAGAREASSRLPDRERVTGIRDDARRLQDELERATARARDAERAARQAATRHDQARARHGGGAAELATLAAAARRLATTGARMPELERAIADGEAAAARADADGAPRASLAARLAAHRAVSAAAADDDRAAASRRRPHAGCDAARRLRARADEEATAAEAALEAARLADHAAALRDALSPGDACPVCGNTVGTLEHADPALAQADAAARGARDRASAAARRASEADGALNAAGARAAETRAALEQAKAALTAAGGSTGDDLEAIEAALARSEEAAAEAGRLRGETSALSRELAAVKGETQRLRAQLGDWMTHPDPAGALDAALAELKDLEDSARATSTAASTAGQAADTARERLVALERGEIAPLRQTATLVAHVLGRPAPPADLDPDALIAAVDGLEAAARRAVRDAEEAERAARADADAAREGLAVRAAPLGVESIGALEAATNEAGAVLSAARRRLADCEHAAAEATRLAGLARRAREDAARRRQIVADLRVDRFPRHLLQRYLTRLSAGASARLELLSAGAFRFAHTGRDPLAVVDVRRGERVRAAATLSGGERFLASLALALGLADIAAESGGRLECLFLDEGFSALDAESLEQAMEGVERLAGDGRLVGVITHLPGVVERLGAAIHVRKDISGASHIDGAPPPGR